MGYARVECFELLCDPIKIRNPLVLGNFSSTCMQWRSTYKPSVFEYLSFKSPPAPFSYHHTRVAYATLRAEHVRTVACEFVTRRTADRVSAQHVKRRLSSAFHFTYFAYCVAGHAQCLELLGAFDFLPCLNSAALLLS